MKYFFLLLFVLVSPAYAYTTTIDTGETVTHGARRAVLEYARTNGLPIRASVGDLIFAEDYLAKYTDQPAVVRAGEQLSFTDEQVEEAFLRAQEMSFLGRSKLEETYASSITHYLALMSGERQFKRSLVPVVDFSATLTGEGYVLEKPFIREMKFRATHFIFAATPRDGKGASRVAAMNIHDVHNPEGIVSLLDGAGVSYRTLTVSEGLVYAVGGKSTGNELHILDPHGTPRLKGTYELNPLLVFPRIMVDGDYAYLVGTNRFEIVDVSHPATIKRVYEAEIPEGFQGIEPFTLDHSVIIGASVTGTLLALDRGETAPVLVRTPFVISQSVPSFETNHEYIVAQTQRPLDAGFARNLNKGLGFAITNSRYENTLSWWKDSLLSENAQGSTSIESSLSEDFVIDSHSILYFLNAVSSDILSSQLSLYAVDLSQRGDTTPLVELFLGDKGSSGWLSIEASNRYVFVAQEDTIHVFRAEARLE